jgi:hypothetical protein
MSVESFYFNLAMCTGWSSWFLDGNTWEKLEAVPSSHDVMRSRIVTTSFNILKHIIEEFEGSPFPFSMQLDETTDIYINVVSSLFWFA